MEMDLIWLLTFIMKKLRAINVLRVSTLILGALLGSCHFWFMLFLFVLFFVCPLFDSCSFWFVPYLICAVFDSCPFWLVLFLIRALFGLCPIWFVLFLVPAVFGSCSISFVLFIVRRVRSCDNCLP